MNRLWNQAVLTRLLMLFGALTLSQTLTGCPPCEDCGTTTETPTQAVPTEPYEPPTTPPATQPTSPTPDSPTPNAPTPNSPTPNAPTPDSPTPNAPTPDSPTPDSPTPTPCTDTFYYDFDLDGYGDPDVSEEACTPPDGYVDNGEDCNDHDDELNPETSWYVDSDGDTYGSSDANPTTQCEQPLGYVFDNSDCVDSNPAIHPNAPELCDGIDNDCNSATVEDCWDVANWDEGSWQ